MPHVAAAQEITDGRLGLVHGWRPLGENRSLADPSVSYLRSLMNYYVLIDDGGKFSFYRKLVPIIDRL